MIYDITRPLQKGMPVWPGDTPYALEVKAAISAGDGANVTTIHTSAHAGTHVDAPFHFGDGDRTLEQVDLSVYWGTAQVVTIDKIGALTPDDFAHVDLSRAPRLLIHTPLSHADPAVFHRQFAYPTPDTADLFGAAGIRLFGTDSPSVDPFDAAAMTSHYALQRNGVLILEGLWLPDVPDGLYQLVAMPLKIVGGDGSPVRAVLKK